MNHIRHCVFVPTNNGEGEDVIICESAIEDKRMLITPLNIYQRSLFIKARLIAVANKYESISDLLDPFEAMNYQALGNICSHLDSEGKMSRFMKYTSWARHLVGYEILTKQGMKYITLAGIDPFKSLVHGKTINQGMETNIL